MVAEKAQLGLEARFPMVDGDGELDVGVGEEDVRGDDVQVGDGGTTDRERLAVDDGVVDSGRRARGYIEPPLLSSKKSYLAL